MERHEGTTFVFTKDPDNILLVTSHEEHPDMSLSIHCHSGKGYGSFSMYITQGQAENLIQQLQKKIINLEVHKKIMEV